MLDTVFVLGKELPNKRPEQIWLADKVIFDSWVVTVFSLEWEKNEPSVGLVPESILNITWVFFDMLITVFSFI